MAETKANISKKCWIFDCSYHLIDSQPYDGFFCCKEKIALFSFFVSFKNLSPVVSGFLRIGADDYNKLFSKKILEKFEISDKMITID